MTKYQKPASEIDDTPLSVISVNAEWRTIFDGILNELTKKDSWLGNDSDAQIATQSVLRTLLWNGDIGGAMILRQSVVNPLILEQSLDNGANWQDAFNYGVLLQSQNDSSYQQAELSKSYDAMIESYDGTIASIAPKAVYGASGVDGVGGNVWRDTALCVAIRELVKMACDIELERRANVRVFASVINAVLVLVGGLISAGVIVLSAGTLAPIAVAVGGAIIGVGASLFVELSDEILRDVDTQELVACCAYNTLKGQSLTQANLLNSLTSCNFGVGTNTAQMAGAIAYILGEIDVYLALLDSIERNYNYAKLGLASCACNPTNASTVSFIWDYTNVSTPLVPPIGFTFWSDRGLIATPVPFRGYGQYIGGGASQYSSLNMHFTMPLTTLRKLRLFGFANSSVSQTFRRVVTKWYRGGLLVRNSTHGLATRLNANQLVVMDSNHAIDRLEILVESQQGFSGVCAYRLELNSVI